MVAYHQNADFVQDLNLQHEKLFRSICYLGPLRTKTERLYSYFYHYKLDVDKMREATSYLIGRHDFASFCGTGAQVKSTVRTLTGIDIWRDGDVVTIRVKGEGFLYNMVRIIAGTLIQVGNGQYPPERVKKILDACDRSVSGPTAPAHGLTLMGIEFFD